MLGRVDLLGKKTVKRDTVTISIGEVGIREMTGSEREKFMEFVSESEAQLPAGLQAMLVQWCAVDQNGDQLFDERDKDAISQMGGSDIEKIVLSILDLSGLSEKSVEDIKGNSTGDLNVVPGIGSRSH